MNRDFVIRPIDIKDFPSLVKLAIQAGPGFTSLPGDEELLLNKIKESVNSFKIDPIKPANEYYAFVLEFVDTNEIVGIAAIRARAGGFEPFYTYAIRKAKHFFTQLHIDKEIEYLKLEKIYDGPSIVGAMFISPQYRGMKLGGLLSRSRFLFMAEYPERFTDSVIAEMRGVIDETGVSPFWEGTIQHFFGLEFNEADRLSVRDKTFIADLMPVYPIYIPLLPKPVIDCIGQVHKDTIPAVKLLEKEGFAYDGHVDIFDAGPQMSANLNEIGIVKRSKKLEVKEILDKNIEEGQEYLLSNANIDFKLTRAKIHVDEDGVTLDKRTAGILNVEEGAEIRFVCLT